MAEKGIAGGSHYWFEGIGLQCWSDIEHGDSLRAQHPAEFLDQWLDGRWPQVMPDDAAGVDHVHRVVRHGTPIRLVQRLGHTLAVKVDMGRDARAVAVSALAGYIDETSDEFEAGDMRT